MVAERIPSKGSERARGLGSEVGEKLGESAEAQRARRAWWRGSSEGLEGAWSPGCVQYAHVRCGRRGRGRRAQVSSAASDRALACGSRARSEALASARGKRASDSSSTCECKPSHTRVIRSRVLPYL